MSILLALNAVVTCNANKVHNMNNKTIQFLGFTPVEFQEVLSDLIQPKFDLILKELKKNPNNHLDEEDLITRDMAAKLLGVNLSSLWRFTKQGSIKSYSLPNTSRVYYKKSEIMASIKPTKD